MRKILTTLVLCALAVTAQADPYRHGHHHHGGGWGWVAPALISGAVVYSITRPPVVVQQPPVVVQSPSGTVYTPSGVTPVYQYQSIWFDDCSCYKQVLVKIQ